MPYETIVTHLSAIAFLYFFAYLPILVTCHDHTRDPSIYEAIVYLVFGWAILAVVAALLTTAGFRPELCTLLPGTILIIGFCFYGPRLFHVDSQSGHHIVIVILGSILIAMPIFASFLMGSGSYPKMFFSIDTPYYLFHAHALLNFDVFPPPNLGLFDPTHEGLAYHYGTSMMAALLSRVTGIPIHQAMFIYLMPLLLMAMIAAATC